MSEKLCSILEQISKSKSKSLDFITTGKLVPFHWWDKISIKIAWLLSQAIFCYGKVSCSTGWWIIRRLALNTPSAVFFLSQIRCTTKVNSLKYNVIRDAFNYSIYSYFSFQQTHIGKKCADKRKYIISNSKPNSFLHEAESFNYLKTFSKDLNFIHRNWIIVHVWPRSEMCQVLLWKPASNGSPTFSFQSL